MSTTDFTRVLLGLEGSNHLESWDHVFINYVDKHHHDFDLFQCKGMFVSSKNGGGSFNKICDKSILHGNLSRHWRNMHTTNPLNVLMSQWVSQLWNYLFPHQCAHGKVASVHHRTHSWIYKAKLIGRLMEFKKKNYFIRSPCCVLFTCRVWIVEDDILSRLLFVFFLNLVSLIGFIFCRAKQYEDIL